MYKKKILVFDWGDTLMQTFSSQKGPMAFWPEVAQVDGAWETLQALNGKYSQIVASNADDSTADQVMLALERVGLNGFIEAVYTFRELGFRKPEVGFFRKIESILGAEPEEMVMVGDNYSSDILGAKQSGWQAIWLNQSLKFSPGLAAIYDGEIFEMKELPEAMEKLTLPDLDKCRAWYLETSPSMRLWLHAQLVASTAYVLAMWIRRQGGLVVPLKAQRGGLLHDICKLGMKIKQLSGWI